MAKSPNDTDRVSFTIAEFCARHGLSRSTYYNLQLRDLGPQTFKIGRLVRITRDAERAWVTKVESGDLDPEPPRPSNLERRRGRRRSRRR